MDRSAAQNTGQRARDPVLNALVARPGLARWTLVAWTVFVWGSRIRNVLTDSEQSGGEQALSIIPALVFLAGAALVAGPGWRLAGFVRGFALLSTLWWALRSVAVLVRDHSAAFKVVHVVLAVISVGLAAWAARAAEARASTP